VRLVNTKRSIIACSYVREDGKRGATAVLPNYRGYGVGNALVSETLRVIPRQFGEVETKNISHIKLLSKNGFKIAYDILDITSRLGTLSKYILSWEKKENRIEYIRISRDNKGMRHKFIFMYT